jgi:hypothetical protein
LSGKLLPHGRVQLRLKDSEGIGHIHTYYLHHIQPYNVFQCICGQGSPIYWVKRTKKELEGESTEELDKFEKVEQKRRAAIADSKKAKVEVKEEADKLIKSMIDMKAAEERGFVKQ